MPSCLVFRFSSLVAPLEEPYLTLSLGQVKDLLYVPYCPRVTSSWLLPQHTTLPFPSLSSKWGWRGLEEKDFTSHCFSSTIHILHDHNGLYRVHNILKWKWSRVAQSCPTLCDPMDCNLPGSSVHGIFQARILEWVAISSWMQMGKKGGSKRKLLF